jgi:UDP-N-acetylglucosamine acyltransferase
MAAPDIHPSAIVAPEAEIADNVRIGPFYIIGDKVRLGEGVELKSHVIVTGDTRIGAGSVVFPFTVLGEVPQDLKFSGEQTRLRIGAHNVIREHVTMNTGTAGGEGVTRVGDGGLYMANCHVAHDCQVGDGVIMVNSAALAGHCIIEDNVILGGLTGVHQFVRIGRGAMIGALTMVTADVVPFGLVQAPRGELGGLNLVGLKRRGVDRADINALRAALMTLKDGEGSFQERAARLGEESESAYVREIAAFILADSDRGFLTPS